MKIAAQAILIAGVMAGFASTAAQADTIASWTFETSVPATAGPFQAEIGNASAQATAVHASTATVYSNPVGNGSNESFSSDHWGVNDYYQFTAETTGFTDLELSWDQAGSGTGPAQFALAYSTNGTTFTNFASYTVLLSASPTQWLSSTHDPRWSFAFDLSAIPDLNNQPLVYFRLIDQSTTSINNGTVGTGGTGRVDNFTISGASAVPLPAAVWLLGSGLLGVAGFRRRRAAI